MASAFLEFVASIRALGIDNPIYSEHFYVWQRNGSNNALLPSIANLNRAQALTCLLFSSSDHLIDIVSRMNLLSIGHLEVFFSLTSGDRVLENLQIISLLNRHQLFVCRKLGIFTIPEILALSARDITLDHILVYHSFPKEDRTSATLRLIVSLDQEYLEAFLSLPLSEHSLAVLEEISFYRYKIIEIFLDFPNEEQNLNNLKRIADLTDDRIDLLSKLPVCEHDYISLQKILELSDLDVQFCLSLSELDLYLLKTIVELSDRKRQIILALDKRYRVMNFVNHVSYLDDDQVNVWFSLETKHHSPENFIKLQHMLPCSIKICQDAAKEGKLTLDFFDAVSSATDRHIEVFSNLSREYQTQANLFKILRLSPEKLELCYSLMIFDIKVLEKIATLSDRQFKVFQSIDVEDSEVEVKLDSIIAFEDPRIEACLAIIKAETLSYDIFMLIKTMSVERLRAFLSLSVLYSSIAILQDLDLLTKKQFKVLVQMGINLDHLRFVFSLSRVQITRALEFKLVNKEEIVNNIRATDVVVAPIVPKILEKAKPNIKQKPEFLVNKFFQEAAITTIVCRDIAPQFDKIYDHYNYSKAVCNIAPVFSKVVVKNIPSYELTLLIHQTLRYGSPQNYDDAVTFSLKYMTTYAVPKVLTYFCSTKLSYSITMLSALGSMLYIANDSDSKSITEIWADVIIYNSYPGAVGMFAMSIAQSAGFAFLPSLAIGTATALAADYLWTAYDEGNLQILPSFLDFSHESILA